jgi:nucleotide-binding universal stress UspA family protein
MIRSILVPLDGSPFSEQALPLAVTIARLYQAEFRLVLVHVPPPAPLAADDARLYVTVDLQRRDTERAYLEQLAGRIRTQEKLTVVAVMLDDPIADAIVEQARAAGAGLIVMTTHGRGSLSRLWLGSVADELIRTLTVPVLLFRPREGKPAPIPASGQRILLPLDGSPAGEAAIAPAADLGERLGLGLTLVQVVPPQAMVGEAPVFVPFAPADELVEILRRESEAYLARVAEPLCARGLRVNTTVVVFRPVAEALLELARAEEVAMVAVSTHGRRGLQRVLLGSVADKLIRAGERPVLVVRPTR